MEELNGIKYNNGRKSSEQYIIMEVTPPNRHKGVLMQDISIHEVGDQIFCSIGILSKRTVCTQTPSQKYCHLVAQEMEMNKAVINKAAIWNK